MSLADPNKSIEREREREIERENKEASRVVDDNDAICGATNPSSIEPGVGERGVKLVSQGTI